MNICEPGPTLPSGHLPRASGSPNCTLEEERGTSLQPDSRLCAVKVHRPRVRPPTCLSPADFPVLPGMARLRSSPEILPGVPGQMGLAHPYKASTWDRSERARMPSRRMRMRSLAVRSPRPPSHILTELLLSGVQELKGCVNRAGPASQPIFLGSAVSPTALLTWSR